MARADVRGALALERVDLGAEDVVSTAEHAAEGLGEFGVEFGDAASEVQQRDLADAAEVTGSRVSFPRITSSLPSISDLARTRTHLWVANS